MFHRCDDHGENLSLTRRTLNITQKKYFCKFNYTKNIYFSPIFPIFLKSKPKQAAEVWILPPPVCSNYCRFTGTDRLLAFKNGNTVKIIFSDELF